MKQVLKLVAVVIVLAVIPSFAGRASATTVDEACEHAARVNFTGPIPKSMKPTALANLLSNRETNALLKCSSPKMWEAAAKKYLGSRAAAKARVAACKNTTWGAALPPAERTPPPACASTTTQSATQRVLLPALAWCQANISRVTGLSSPRSTDFLGDCVEAYSEVGPAAPTPNSALVAALTFPFNAGDLDGSPAGVGTKGVALCTDPVNTDVLRSAAAAIPTDADLLRVMASSSHTTLAQYVCQRAHLANSLIDSAPAVNSPTMTLDEFNRIATGMNHDEVTGIVGSPGTLSAQSSVGGFTDEIYSWSGSGGGGANANVSFQNGQVVGKAQVGLS